MMVKRAWEVWDEERAENYARIHGTPQNPMPAQQRRMEVAADLLEGKTVLDVGCGIGHLYPFLKDKVDKYVGVDNSRAMLEQAKQFSPEATFSYGDIFKLGRFGRYDSVYCLSVLMHIPYMVLAVKELWKHTKKALIFGVQCSPEAKRKKIAYKQGYVLMRRDPSKFILQLARSLPHMHKVRGYFVPNTQDTYFKVTR